MMAITTSSSISVNAALRRVGRTDMSTSARNEWRAPLHSRSGRMADPPRAEPAKAEGPEPAGHLERLARQVLVGSLLRVRERLDGAGQRLFLEAFQLLGHLRVEPTEPAAPGPRPAAATGPGAA